MNAPAPLSPVAVLLRKARTAWRMLRTDGASAVRARLVALWHARQGSAGTYARWIRQYDRLRPADLARMRELAATWSDPPVVAVLLPDAGHDAAALQRSLRSLQAQAYRHWTLQVAMPADAAMRRALDGFAAQDPRIHLCAVPPTATPCAAMLDSASGEWVTLLAPGDRLSPAAFWHMARAATAQADACLVYADEDTQDVRGRRRDPCFKSDWNPELFLALGMADRTAWLRRTRVAAVGGVHGLPPGTEPFALQLRCLAGIRPAQVVHVPRVLYHAAAPAQATTGHVAQEAGRAAVAQFLHTSGWAGEVTVTPSGHYRIGPQRTETPLVSLVIPTRNQAGLVRQCLDSILEKTTYPRYEILLVDNGSDDPEALACFAAYAQHPSIRVIRDDRPFNYSALNNAAVAQAAGTLIGLVNNDIEVITPGWLDEMVAIALRPGVGAVGAKLWYPDDRLQHGGVVTGFRGVAGHAHWGLGREDRGYQERAALPGVWSAVTAACLLVRRSSFEEVGGLDEAHLAVAFNDVDFCLRLDAAGYRNVWTPYAELYHHESASRGQDTTGEKKARFEREVRHMHTRWGARLPHDPYYNPNLCMEHDSFLLASPPRIAYPF